MTKFEPGIVGRDAGVLVPFYADVMGFHVTRELHFEGIGTVIKLRRDDARMKLFFPFATLDPPRDDEPWFRAGGWRYATLYVDAADTVDDLAAAVAAAGGRVLQAPSEHRAGARMTLVVDPEGNPWEILCDDGAPGEASDPGAERDI